VAREWLDSIEVLLRGRVRFSLINMRAFASFGHIGLMAGLALFTATVVGGSGYLIREFHRQAGVASAIVGLPSPAVDPSLLVPVSSDMLKVTSIVLGRTPVAIVNGIAVTQGGTVQVHTANGIADLHVVSIRDGVVQFKYGEQIILANLR
jgi:hypothetical protein